MPENEHHAMQTMIGALHMASRVLQLSVHRPDLGILMSKKIIELARACELGRGLINAQP